MALKFLLSFVVLGILARFIGKDFYSLIKITDDEWFQISAVFFGSAAICLIWLIWERL